MAKNQVLFSALRIKENRHYYEKGALMISLSLFILLEAAIAQGCEDPNENDWVLVGCSPSPQECYYSCPRQGAYRAEENPEICPEEPSTWACYCPRD